VEQEKATLRGMSGHTRNVGTRGNITADAGQPGQTAQKRSKQTQAIVRCLKVGVGPAQVQLCPLQCGQWSAPGGFTLQIGLDAMDLAQAGVQSVPSRQQRETDDDARNQEDCDNQEGDEARAKPRLHCS
jgi:hypothetical protein